MGTVPCFFYIVPIPYICFIVFVRWVKIIKYSDCDRALSTEVL